MHKERIQYKKQIVSVLFNFHHDKVYDYSYQKEPPIKRGEYVLAQLGSSSRIGIVWEEKSRSECSKLKEIESRLDLPPLPEISRRFIQWVSKYTLSPQGSLLKMAIGSVEMASLWSQPNARLRLGKTLRRYPARGDSESL